MYTDATKLLKYLQFYRGLEVLVLFNEKKSTESDVEIHAIITDIWIQNGKWIFQCLIQRISDERSFFLPNTTLTIEGRNPEPTWNLHTNVHYNVFHNAISILHYNSSQYTGVTHELYMHCVIPAELQDAEMANSFLYTLVIPEGTRLGAEEIRDFFRKPIAELEAFLKTKGHSLTADERETLQNCFQFFSESKAESELENNEHSLNSVLSVMGEYAGAEDIRPFFASKQSALIRFLNERNITDMPGRIWEFYD